MKEGLQPGSEESMGSYIDPRRQRIIEPLMQDIWAFMEQGAPLNLIVSEDKVAAFCRGCDRLKEDGVCLNGSNNQARYAAREYCGWASIKDVRGEMTIDGFVPYK